jgi:hypothetical protein
MDELKDGKKLLQAIVELNALKNGLQPQGRIEDKYVRIYHQALTDIQNTIRRDLSRYSIPPEELKPRMTSGATPRIGRRAGSPARYSSETYCDRDMFLLKITSAISFINSLIVDAKCSSCGAPITFSWLRA